MGDAYPKKGTGKWKEYRGTLEMRPGSRKDCGDGPQGWGAGMAPVEGRRAWAVETGKSDWERCH